MSGMTWLGLVGAGALGAMARVEVDEFVTKRVAADFPWGALIINLSGSLALGFLTGLGLYHGLGSATRTVLGTGFCGAYTTFAPLAAEALRLADEGETSVAVLNVVATIAIGLTGAAAGLGAAALL